MEQARVYAKRYDNVWLELSSQSLGNIQSLLDDLGPERLLYGTDWPFYHQAIALAKDSRKVLPIAMTSPTLCM